MWKGVEWVFSSLSFARETILLDHLRDHLDDSLEEDLTTESIARTELDLDKDLIVLIQLACKQDHLQRALDATKLLHHTSSFDMAMKVADFYRLPGLGEKIAFLKEEREEEERLKEERQRRKGWRRAAGPVPPAREGFHSEYRQGQTYRPLQDTRPAPAIARTRLTVATPSDEPSPFASRPQSNGITNGFSKQSPMQLDDDNNDNDEDESQNSDSKRKRAEEDDVVDITESISSAPKRRQVDTGSSTTNSSQLVTSTSFQVSFFVSE